MTNETFADVLGRHRKKARRELREWRSTRKTWTEAQKAKFRREITKALKGYSCAFEDVQGTLVDGGPRMLVSVGNAYPYEVSYKQSYEDALNYVASVVAVHELYPESRRNLRYKNPRRSTK